MPPTTFAKQSTELKPVHTYDGLGTENWTTQWLTLGVIFACINFRFGTSRHGGSQVFESMTGLLLNLPNELAQQWVCLQPEKSRRFVVGCYILYLYIENITEGPRCMLQKNSIVAVGQLSIKIPAL